jgi:hypothetical protein
MLYNVTVSREFTAGTLAGLVIPQTIKRVSKCPAIGSKHAVVKPFAGSPYVDTVTHVEAA